MAHNYNRTAWTVAVAFVCAGVVVLSASALFSPGFVAKYLSPDGVLENITIFRVHLLRVCAAGAGLILAYCSTLALVVASRAKRPGLVERVAQVLTTGESRWILDADGAQIVDQVLSRRSDFRVHEGLYGQFRWWRISRESVPREGRDSNGQ